MSTAEDADGAFSVISHVVISIHFIFLFHYICLKYIHGFGKTKARTKPNQNTQRVVLKLKKGKENKKGDEEWGWKAPSGGTGVRGCKH